MLFCVKMDRCERETDGSGVWELINQEVVWCGPEVEKKRRGRWQAKGGKHFLLVGLFVLLALLVLLVGVVAGATEGELLIIFPERD